MSRRMLRLALIAAVAAMLALVPAARRSAAADRPSLVGPKAYYLALGDSLAYGIQPDLDNDEGYPADFFTDLQTHGTQSIADMGCSGETSVTFVQGGCIYAKIFPPHYPYTGPQLNAALAFIQQHPGQVSPVTIDIGANDLLDVINQSNCTITDLTATVQTIFTNYTTILSQLKTALNGTGDLISMTYYFPYQNICPNLVPLIQYLDAGLAAVGQRYGAIMVPVFTAFGGATTPNPYLCNLTWVCQTTTYFTCKLVSQLCIHPTTLGYHVIANTIEKTVGY